MSETRKGVLIYGETTEGKLAAIATELLGAGRKLADELHEELTAVIIGADTSAAAQEAIGYGADKVYTVDNAALSEYQSELYLSALDKAVQLVQPAVILFGQTVPGIDLAPRLAFRFKTGLSMDCIDLAIDAASRRLLQTKPVYGGNANAIFVTAVDPQVATVRCKAMAPREFDGARKGEVVKLAVTIDTAAVKTKVLQRVAEKVEGIKLEDAKVIIAGGRGMAGPDGFKQLDELAQLMHGAVGASRPACDSGWIPSTTQVGLTGKIVAPDLYIAVAISGSSQHMSGCSGSKKIVAINKDPEANIFKEAAFGVVGDWKKILPAFKTKVKELISQ